MIFNCLNCGVSISSRQENCTHCRISNQESLQYLTGQVKHREVVAWKEKVRGTIFSFVTR